MTCDYCREEELRSKGFAKRAEIAELKSTDLFLELCTPSEAELALFKLWEESNLDCDQTDYDSIVEYYVTLASNSFSE